MWYLTSISELRMVVCVHAMYELRGIGSNVQKNYEYYKI